MVVRKDIDNATAILTVSFTRDEVKKKFESELKRLRSQITIKGFRIGHAPIERIKMMHGTSIMAETLQELMGDAVYNFLRETELRVLGQPMPVEGQEKLSVSYKNMPEIYAMDYELGFIPDFEITGLGEEDVYERFQITDLDKLAMSDYEALRKRKAKRITVDDNIQDNDFVRMWVRELEGDDYKEGGYETEISFLVNAIVDEAFKTKVLALKKGGILRFNPRIIDNYPREEMFRRYIMGLSSSDERKLNEMFEGAITAVERIDHDNLEEGFFEKNFNAAQNHEEAIMEIKEEAEKFYAQQADILLSRNIHERLLEINQFDLPQAFLKRWLQANDKNNEFSDEDFDRQFPNLSRSIRWDAMKTKIIEKFDITIARDDYFDHFKSALRQYIGANIPEEVVANYAVRMLNDKTAMDSAKEKIETEKVYEALRSQVKIVDKPLSIEEFKAIVQELNKRDED